LNDNAKYLVEKLGTKPPLLAARCSSPGQAYDHKQMPGDTPDDHKKRENRRKRKTYYKK
jgi:hypothetical protein